MEDVQLLKNRSKMLDTVASRYAELCEASYLIRQLTPYLKKENPILGLLSRGSTSSPQEHFTPRWCVRHLRRLRSSSMKGVSCD